MLEMAIKKAQEQESISRQKRVYAIITDKKGRILSEGMNSYTKTHPTQYHYAVRAKLPDKEYLHAEISALVKVRNKTPHSIYIARVDASGSPCLAKPCPVCYLAIQESGIKNIYYTE